MTDFDPGDGWRRLESSEVLDPGAEVINYSTGDGIRAWVREEPVPPLPVEPWTVIRVTWRDPEYLRGSHVYLLTSDRYWVPQNRHADTVRTGALAVLITGFEVLASPVTSPLDEAHMQMHDERARRETAKAVFDRVEDVLPKEAAVLLIRARREFGVES